MLSTIRSYLQSYMDSEYSGYVNIWVCDGIPGNCTVSPMDSQVVEAHSGLRGDMAVRKRARFSLLYLDTSPYGNWIAGLEDWCYDRYAQGDLPEGFRMWVELTGCKQNPDGTFAITACLTAEYETTHEGTGSMAEPLFTVDDEAFDVEVTQLSREMEIVTAYDDCTTLDGVCHRDILGTYCHYTMTVCCRHDPEELERFWEAISQPEEVLNCSFPYGQGQLTQKMYIRSASQKLTDTRRGNCWDSITVRFLGTVPLVKPC